MNIKKGDLVEVITGRRKDAGKRGEVLKVLPKTSRVVVQGVNQRKKHQKAHQAARGGRQTAPEILVFDAPLSVANVRLVCPKCHELTSVKRRRQDSGKTSRICRKCEAELDA